MAAATEFFNTIAHEPTFVNVSFRHLLRAVVALDADPVPGAAGVFPQIQHVRAGFGHSPRYIF